MVQVHSRVGSDGVLKLSVPLGAQDANRDVVVTIESLSSANQVPLFETSWQDFLDQTYGSCSGFGLVRAPQGEFELRESIH
jgi:hypothetical protein